MRNPPMVHKLIEGLIALAPPSSETSPTKRKRILDKGLLLDTMHGVLKVTITTADSEAKRQKEMQDECDQRAHKQFENRTAELAHQHAIEMDKLALDGV